MRSYIQYVQEHCIGIPVRITYTVHPSNDSVSSRQIIGEITELHYDERDGGFMVFKHSYEEAERLMETEVLFNLASVIIWGVGILTEDYEVVHHLSCPTCNQSLALGVNGVHIKEEEEDSEEE